MHPTDIPKTAFITPFGLWEFVVMPFVLRKKAAKVLAPLTDGFKGPASAFPLDPRHAVLFASAKALLIQVVGLSHPIPNAALSVVTDASATHV